MQQQASVLQWFFCPACLSGSQISKPQDYCGGSNHYDWSNGHLRGDGLAIYTGEYECRASEIGDNGVDYGSISGFEHAKPFGDKSQEHNHEY
jgi:hypothetical protein